MCESLITLLLHVKRGEVADENLVECLESLKDGVDRLIRAAEFGVPEEPISGC